MTWIAFVDSQFSSQLCFTLFHSLWQAALLAGLAWAIQRVWGRQSVDRSYTIYVLALVASLMAVPITYLFVAADSLPTNLHDGALTVERRQSVQSNAVAASQVANLSGARRPTVRTVSDAPSKAGAAWRTRPAEDAILASARRLTPAISVVYAIGVALMLARLTASIWRVNRLCRDSPLIVTGPSVEFAQELSRQWSMRAVPVLSCAEQIVVPKVVGLIRPVVLLPVSAISGLSPRELELVLAHELAHVRRHDLWINLLQRVAEAVLFFNPSLWFVSRRISVLREYCCDELACAAVPSRHQQPRIEYALALLRIVERSSRAAEVKDLGAHCGRTELASLAVSGRSPSELRRRVARLFGEPLREPLQLSRGGAWAIVAVVALLLAGPAAWESAAETKQTKAAPAMWSREFAFRVVGPDGKPVPSAEVEIRARPAVSAKQILRGKFVRTSRYGTVAACDEEGRLTLRLLAQPKHFALCIKQAGFGPYWASWDSAAHPQPIPAEFSAELEAAWSVGGVVVDEAGRPVEGAVVSPRLIFKKRPGDLQELGTGVELTTDADGGWRFDIVPDTVDEVPCEISHPEYMPLRQPLARSSFELMPNAAPQTPLVLQRGLTITGTISDDAGKPVAGALVRTKFQNDLREARTDADGVYRLVGCESRMARVVVSARGKALDMKEVRVAPDMEPVDFTMQPGGKLRVRALDEQGNPIPKTRIFFQRWRGPIDYFEFDHVDGYADENGIWEWNEAPLDEIKADICRPDGMQLVEQSLIARDEEYVFYPPQALVISGRVVDAESKAPIERFRVVPGIRSKSSPPAQWFRHSSFEATGGQYEARENRQYPGHLVRIEADGYLAAVSREIKSDEGNITIDFELQRGKDVAPAIVTPGGEPAAGAKIALGVEGSQISIQNGSIDDGQTYAARRDSDVTGSFSFPQPDTDYQLVITHPEGYAYVKATPDNPPSTIMLTAWASAEGTFRIGSETQANVPLELGVDSVHSYGPGVPSIFTHYNVTTGPDGRYKFPCVFAGEGWIGRRILLMVDEGAMDITSSTRIKTIFRSGETTKLDLGGTGRPVIGRLQVPEDFEEKVLWNFALINARLDLPAPMHPDMPLEVQADSDRRRAWWFQFIRTEQGKAFKPTIDAYEAICDASPYITATVAPDGTFRIDDVAPGNYRMNVHFSEHNAGRLTNYRFNVPMNDNADDAKPLDVGVITLE